LRQMSGSGGNALDAIYQSDDHLHTAFGNAKHLGDIQNVVPDIGQCVRGERQNARLEIAPATDGLFDFGQTDRANFALRLREDEIRPQLFQHPGVDLVDRQRLLQEGIDLAIDLDAGSLDVQLRLSADREAANGRWKITFV